LPIVFQLKGEVATQNQFLFAAVPLAVIDAIICWWISLTKMFNLYSVGVAQYVCVRVCSSVKSLD
jgi:hypothetical protein